jgi:2-methylcitrate dehydratase PrpD
MQAAIEAASRLSKEGLKVEQIQSITIGIHGAMISKLASNQPVDVQQAQLSTPFAVAMALIIGESRNGLLALSIDDYESNIQDPIVRDLCSRTTCVVDSEVESLTTKESVAGRVTCYLKDGTTRSVFIASPKGCPENPMSIEEVANRFQGLGASVFLKLDCDNWLHHALHVQDLQSITSLTNLRK